jgi:hypothetical protein
MAPAIGTAPRPLFGRRRPSSLTRQLGAAALVALLALVLTATTSHASQCRPLPQAIATTLCEDGVCSEGFGIDYVPTGYGCGTRPVVRELSEAVLSLFAWSARHSYHRHLSGVYEAEVRHACLGHGWRGERCITPTSIRRLSESVDPQTLDAYRSEWLDTERQSYRSHRSAMWKIAAVLLSLTILVIGWPWALSAWIPAFRRCLGWTLLVAIPIQLFTGLYFSVSVWLPFGPVPVLLKVSDTICAIAIVVAIPLQLGTFIRRKLKARARPA